MKFEGGGTKKLKKIGLGILCLLVLSSLTVYPFSSIKIANAQSTSSESNIFSDDFESYVANTFPSQGGWELVFSGAGNQYQIVTDAQAYEGSKSFQLWGQPNWAACVQKTFTTSASIIGYEFAIYHDSVGSGGPSRTDHPGFWRLGVPGYPWGKYWATVRFNHDDMKIYSDNDAVVLGTWQPKVWYIVKVVLDRTTDTYSVWINGELKGQGLKTEHTGSDQISALVLNADHPGAKVYYDNVRVFVGTRGQPDLQLTVMADRNSIAVGETAIATVTLRNNGSADAKNVDVSVSLGTWLDLVSGSTSWHYDSLSVGASDSRSLTVKGRAEGSGTVNVQVTYFDSQGNRYQKSTFISIEVVRAIEIRFNVLHDDSAYDVLLYAPFSSYNRSLQYINRDILQSWYPDIELSTLEAAHYLSLFVEAPDLYPIFNVSILQNGQPISDKELKSEVLNKLLIYCYELLFATWPQQLNNYQSFGESWLKIYADSSLTVKISDGLSSITYFLTIIAPIIDDIKGLYGETTSEQVKSAVSLFSDVNSGYDQLSEVYGDEKADAIVNVLEDFGFIKTKDYNSLKLYQKFSENPDKAMQVIEKIELEVFNLQLTSDAKTILSNFIANLKESAIEEFQVGAAVGLYAYFGSGLTASTATLIGASEVFTGLISTGIPLALSDAIYESYILPMAHALHVAWEETKNIAETYFNMLSFGYEIANPDANVFNLTKSEVFTDLVGMLYIEQYTYYVYSYFYRSHQLDASKSELNGLKSSAGICLSQAKEWRNMLETIMNEADVITSSTDPEGATFNFTLITPINTLPVAPENSSGFILSVSRTLEVLMRAGNYVFLYQNRTWLSNFTYSFYTDDPYGSSYLIIFNPPDLEYTVKAQNETQMFLINFQSEKGEITISNAGNITGNMIKFNVKSSQVDPETVVLEFPTSGVPQYTPYIIGATVAVVLVAIGFGLARKRRRTPSK